MRPTPTELISQVRRVLREVVEPELRSDYARARLGEVRAVLAQVDWDNAGIALARETVSLRELLAEFRSWVDADERREAHFGPALAADLPAAETGDFAACNELHARYSAEVVSLIDPLENWLGANPGDERGHDLRARLLKHSAG